MGRAGLRPRFHVGLGPRVELRLIVVAMAEKLHRLLRLNIGWLMPRLRTKRAAASARLPRIAPRASRFDQEVFGGSRSVPPRPALPEPAEGFRPRTPGSR